MSIGAAALRAAYRLSGAKKAFALPEDQLLKAIEKANRGRASSCLRITRPIMKRK